MLSSLAAYQSNKIFIKKKEERKTYDAISDKTCMVHHYNCRQKLFISITDMAIKVAIKLQNLMANVNLKLMIKMGSNKRDKIS